LLHGWKQSGGDLRGALAAYNSGNPGSAIGRKYGASVFRQADVAVPAIPSGKLAQWASSDPTNMGALPPVRPVLTWTPQASPLAPKGDGIEVALR
jgi:type IV secretion system protein VirB1